MPDADFFTVLFIKGTNKMEKTCGRIYMSSSCKCDSCIFYISENRKPYIGLNRRVRFISSAVPFKNPTAKFVN